MRYPLLAAMILLSTAAQAHEVWIERDGTGPARIYLGEPAETPPPGGDPEFAKLKAPHVLALPKVALARRAGFLEAEVPAGDVRVWDDAVFAPWGEEGKKEGVVYYARAGRAEAAAKLPFELAPVVAGGTRFVLTRDGRPVAGVPVSVIAPDRSKIELTTDAAGTIDAATARPGRYLLVASKKEAGAISLPGGAAQTVYRITTTSFVAP